MVERAEVEYGMSLEDYLHGYDDQKFEIIDGEVVFMSPTVSKHDLIVQTLFVALHNYIGSHPEWRVFQEAAFVKLSASRSKWVKGSLVPDVMVARKADFEAFKASTPDWLDMPFMFVPPLVIEVLSKTDTYTTVLRKINQYLAQNVQVVWLVDPFDRVVKVYRVGQDADHPDVLHESALLAADDLLLGFSISVASLFDFFAL